VPTGWQGWSTPHPKPQTLIKTESCTVRSCPRFKDNYFAEICSGFRGGLAFKAHRLLCQSTLGSRVIKKRREEDRVPAVGARALRARGAHRVAGLVTPSSLTPNPAEKYRGTLLIRNSPTPLGPPHDPGSGVSGSPARQSVRGRYVRVVTTAWLGW